MVAHDPPESDHRAVCVAGTTPIRHNFRIIHWHCFDSGGVRVTNGCCVMRWLTLIPAWSVIA